MTSKSESRKLPAGNSLEGEAVERATASYEQWMGECTTVVSSDLALKHAQMRESAFLFLRGAFYRWAQMWPRICADLSRGPKVLAVGDLHVNSFGT